MPFKYHHLVFPFIAAFLLPASVYCTDIEWMAAPPEQAEGWHSNNTPEKAIPEYAVSVKGDDLVVLDLSGQPDAPLPEMVRKYKGTCGIPYASGWLIGTDGGEWSGNLSYINNMSVEQEITFGGFKDNVLGFIVIEKKTYALCGGGNIPTGSIWEVYSDKNAVQSRRFSLLPGTPSVWIPLKKHDLLIVTDEALVSMTGMHVDIGSSSQEMHILCTNSFWGSRNPNSLVRSKGYYYVGMRGGIMRFQVPDLIECSTKVVPEFGKIK